MLIRNVFVIVNEINFDPNSYYCYALFDPDSKMPFYVGKGKGYRFAAHKYDCCAIGNKHKLNKLKKIVNKHGFVAVKIIKNAKTEREAYKYERLYGNQFDGLTNVAKLGGYYPSAKPQRVVQYNLYGEPVAIHADYHAANKSINGDDNSLKQIHESCRGGCATCKEFYWSYEGNKIMRPLTKIRPVARLDDEGNIIERFSSAYRASQILGGDKTNIPNAIRRSHRAYGNHWKYLEVQNT